MSHDLVTATDQLIQKLSNEVKPTTSTPSSDPSSRRYRFVETTPISLRSVLVARKAVKGSTDPSRKIRIDRIRRAVASKNYEVPSRSVAEVLLEESSADPLG